MRLTVPAAIVLCLSLRPAAGAPDDPGSLEAQSASVCLYQQDFTSNPGWTSLASSYAYWDSSQGNYFVRTRDDLNAAYYGYSPAFTAYDGTSPLDIQLDVLFESPNWGTYPGVRFTPSPVTASNFATNYSFIFFNAYTSGTGNALYIADQHGHADYSASIVQGGVWYRVHLVYSGSTHRLDLTVTNRSTGAVVYSRSGLAFQIDPFQYVGAGYFDTADYGSDWSPIRVDNIGICSTATAPQIAAFTASPATVTSGQESTLSWSSSGGTSASISGVGSVATSGSTTVRPAQTTTYTLTVTGPGGSASRQATVTVSPVISSAVLAVGDGSVCSGSSVTLPVSINNGSGMQALEFDLVYDASKLTATGATTGSLTGGFSASSNVSSGRIRVAMASASAVGSSSGEVAKVTFRGESGLSSGSSTTVTIQNVKVNDAAATGGSATVTCRSCRPGDVNGNDSVTAYDASLILQFVVGASSLDSTQQCAADFNRNGSITAYDASLVLQCVVQGSCP